MSWLVRAPIYSLILYAVLGCGVKGDPLPPERPPELGRGRPSYRRATEQLKIEGVPDKETLTSPPPPRGKANKPEDEDDSD